MDLDNNEKVSFEEFMTWYKGSSDEIDQTEKEGAKAIREAKLNELKNRGQVPLSAEERKTKEDQLVKEVSDPAIFMKTIEVNCISVSETLGPQSYRCLRENPHSSCR
jgi:hypothetical protein